MHAFQATSQEYEMQAWGEGRLMKYLYKWEDLNSYFQNPSKASHSGKFLQFQHSHNDIGGRDMRIPRSLQPANLYM